MSVIKHNIDFCTLSTAYAIVRLSEFLLDVCLLNEEMQEKNTFALC